jgi:hypothetical protein
MKTVTSPIPKDRTWVNLLWLTSILQEYLIPELKSLKAAPEGTAFSVYLELFIDVKEPSEGLQFAC